jgi:hypothetical protein
VLTPIVDFNSKRKTQLSRKRRKRKGSMIRDEKEECVFREVTGSNLGKDVHNLDRLSMPAGKC